MEVAFGVNMRPAPAEYGVATLSKYPIVCQANTLLPNDPSTRADQQRGVLNTRIQVGDSVVQRLQHPPPATTSTACAVRQMQTVTGLVRADPLPKILGGDLNSGPASADAPDRAAPS